MRALAQSFIDLVEQFEPMYRHSDKTWSFWLQVSRKWIHLRVQKVHERYYVSDSESNSIAYPPERSGDEDHFTQLAGTWLPALRVWQRRVAKDPLAAQSELAARLSLKLKHGVILRKNVTKAIPALDLAQHFSKKQLDQLVDILQGPPDADRSAMTADMYFEYCRIAYRANPKTFPAARFRKLRTGRELYKAFADGRDGGLLAVKPNSASAFDAWYESDEHRGCHPWEIYRGGNSTHIDLSVYKRQDHKWQVGLTAFSSTRLVETCNIAIALRKAKLPFVLHHADSYLLRLRGEDWVGIIPDGEPIRYAWQDFPKEYHVADVIYFDWLVDNMQSSAARRKRRRQFGHIVNWFSWPVSAWTVRSA